MQLDAALWVARALGGFCYWERDRMTSQAVIETNRRNYQKSTGPKTEEGLARSSMNAYKHGMRSKKKAILREESYTFQNRRQKWLASADPCDDMAEFLVHQNVCLSFDLERTRQAHLERLTSLIENSDDAELEEVYALGKRLFFDPCGPTAMYGFCPDTCSETKTSWKGLAVG
jgi:hypothetical protein